MIGPGLSRGISAASHPTFVTPRMPLVTSEADSSVAALKTTPFCVRCRVWAVGLDVDLLCLRIRDGGGPHMLPETEVVDLPLGLGCGVVLRVVGRRHQEVHVEPLSSV
jgi:hypothetical protein